ncbi:MAG TPA: ATPase [Clostridiales bacterium]|nr:ATPase [Clostridiales bacterium]
MSKTIKEIQAILENGQAVIGIEFGSTRIKAILIDPDHEVIATGNYDWENSRVDNIWTYSLEEITKGLQSSYRNMATRVSERYGVTLRRAAAMGISGMMHGYLVFDQQGRLLTPFRTWRNNITQPASEELTQLFNYPVPQRWNIAHLGQAMLNNEPHLPQIDFMTTLAGYLHWKLTGQKVIGIGEASGVFPIDIHTKTYDAAMLEKFGRRVSECHLPWKITGILPRVLSAGDDAGQLTESGALLIDPTGNLQPGIPFCPPEGDAGTGMIATNSIAVRTGNVSAGTSVFAMVVLEKELSRVHGEIDLVTTPEGNLVAMVHSNNCTSDYDAWISLFGEAARALGAQVTKPALYDTLLGLALEGDPDCGGLLSYGYLSGEHITGFAAGRPLFVRSANSTFNLRNFMRVNLFTSLGALKAGFNILTGEEGVRVDEIRGHGGFFKTRKVGQRIMAAALDTPVSVLETAGEGGAWGIAVLAAFRVQRSQGETLTDYLAGRVFAGQAGILVKPDPADVAGFNDFYARYLRGLPIERAAVEFL